MSYKAVVICGPTASGKTSAAIEIAQKLNGEIIGADSVQIYRYLDIGSAKPTKEELATAPHHMIGIIDPDINYSGGAYSDASREIFKDIILRNKTPIICGGTGMYIDALSKGLFDGPSADQKLRDELKNLEFNDPGVLHRMLSEIDPESARRISINDIFRLTRAIEVHKLTGITLTEHHKIHQNAQPFTYTHTIVIDPPKEILEQRIQVRVDMMLKSGFIEEVKNILDMGYSKDLRCLHSKGYHEVIKFLDNELSLDELPGAVVQSHRKYVKQQRTWFKPRGIHIESPSQIDFDEIKRFMDAD